MLESLPVAELKTPNSLLEMKTKTKYSPVSIQTQTDLLYTIEDTPPWYECLIFGFQVSFRDYDYSLIVVSYTSQICLIQ